MVSEPTSIHDALAFATALDHGTPPRVRAADEETITALARELPFAAPAMYLDYLRTMGAELGPFTFYAGQIRAHEILHWYRAVRDDPEVQIPTDAVVLAAMGVGADLVVLRRHTRTPGSGEPAFAVEDRWYDSDETAALAPSLCQLLCATAYFKLRYERSQKVLSVRAESTTEAASQVVALAQAQLSAELYPFCWRRQRYLALHDRTELVVDGSSPHSAVLHIAARACTDPAQSTATGRSLISTLERSGLTIRAITEHPLSE